MTNDQIPDDVLRMAQAICAEFDPSDTAICIAIMRERERCWKIADDEDDRSPCNPAAAVARRILTDPTP